MVFEEYLETFRARLEKAITFLEVPSQSQSYSLEKIRQQYPRAHETWSPEEDEQLKIKHSTGFDTSELAKCFGRQSGAIQSRLTKLGLE